MAQYPHAEGGYWEYGAHGFPVVGGYDDSIIEDFKDGAIGEYGGDTDGFRVQSENVIQGRRSLESTAESVAIGAASGIPTPRDDGATEYRARMILADDGHATLLTSVQSTSWPWRNCYALSVDSARDEIRLFSRESSNTRYLERKSVSLSAGQEYQPAITLSPEGINAKLHDRNGDLLEETDSYRDDTHAGGGLGWYNGNGRTTYFDHASKRAGTMGDVSRAVLNDFESGNLNEYDVVGGGSSGDQMVTPSASFEGNYGLEMVDFGEIRTLPGMGAEGYIEDGQPITFRINFQRRGDEQYYFTFCPSSATSTSASIYKLEFLMDGGLRIQKNTGSGDFNPDGSSSEGRGYPACYNLSWSTGQWYQPVLWVDSDDGLRAEVYTETGDRKAWVETPDTDLVSSTNGYGHWCTGGGHVYVDEIIEYHE